MRRWLWFGLVVELSKPICAAAVGFSEGLHSMAVEIHNDLVAHYQWLRDQDDFAASVAYDLEQLPDAESS